MCRTDSLLRLSKEKVSNTAANKSSYIYTSVFVRIKAKNITYIFWAFWDAG